MLNYKSVERTTQVHEESGRVDFCNGRGKKDDIKGQCMGVRSEHTGCHNTMRRSVT